MIIVEYRIPMPFCTEEYRIGQLYTIAKKSRQDSTDSKNGVKIIANEPYSNGPGGHGQYTNKTYYLATHIPDWLKRLMPESAAKLKEEAWNAYPYSKNKFTNPIFDKFTLEIESCYLDGPPSQTNVFNLTSKEERLRSVVMIDFAREQYRSRKTTSERSIVDGKQVFAFDPLFRSPLNDDWLHEYEKANEKKVDGHDSSENNNNDDELKKHLMTCYKLCRVNFPIWPLQNRVEQFIQNYCRDTIIEAHRLAWLWQDEWTGMSVEEIRLMEKETEKQLSERMHEVLTD